ncbi:MAG: hypothetical protein QOG43_379 [Actinomycetota bacterium]|nr:hypothetical protein [Actinomycetota bacterium]
MTPTSNRTAVVYDGVILQPGCGAVPGDHYVPATPDGVLWGRLPHRGSEPLFTIERGTTVTIDTVSHEGILEDQGRDPVAFFGTYGVDAADVLTDARDVAASAIDHRFGHDGPHVLNRPVAVAGAMPGDVLVVETVALDRRAPYGIVSSRHGKGALPGEMPEGTGPGLVSTFCTVEEGRGVLRDLHGHTARFPLRPFLGLIAVGVDEDTPPSSVPPGPHGGNLDVRDLGVGSTLYLPVQVEGALLSVGDPHFSQGHGEVALTAFEAPLRATLRIDVLPASAVAGLTHLSGPFGETATQWIAIGLGRDLDAAMRRAVRAALATVVEETGMARSAAYAYLSAAADFVVSQVVDEVVGIHCLIDKAHFAPGP